MYVRMRRYEGGSLGDVLSSAELIRQDIEAAKRGEPVRYLQPDVARVANRIELMVNRVDASVAVIMYCDTIQETGEADRIIASMRPRRSGWGERVSADIYEVMMDESPRLLHLVDALPDLSAAGDGQGAGESLEQQSAQAEAA